jgi:hypothetical protein
MGGEYSTYWKDVWNIFVGKLERMSSRHKWEDNIKMELRKIRLCVSGMFILIERPIGALGFWGLYCQKILCISN